MSRATKFCEISTVDLTSTTWDKSTMEISQKFVAFAEYMNFTKAQNKNYTSQWIDSRDTYLPEKHTY